MLLKKDIFFIGLIGFFFLISSEVRSDDTFSNNLTQSLGALKNNVDQLNVSNEALIQKNEQIKFHLNDLNAPLQKLIQENKQLEEKKAKVEKIPSAKAIQIEQFNKIISDLENQVSNLQQQIKVAQDDLVKIQKEDESLTHQMGQPHKFVKGSSDEESPELLEILEKKQKEKLAMLKMIGELQNRQVLLQEQLLDYSKNIPISINSNNESSGKKSILEAQIQQLRSEIANLNSLEQNGSQKWNEGQIHELELRISSLERNRNELNILVRKMQLKTQHFAHKTDQSTERTKLLSSIEQLKMDYKNLRIDFDELQQQMIDLDKRKVYLQALSKN